MKKKNLPLNSTKTILSQRVSDVGISLTNVCYPAPEPQESRDPLTEGSPFKDDAYLISFRQQNCPVSSVWTLAFLSGHHFITWPVKLRKAEVSARNSLGLHRENCVSERDSEHRCYANQDSSLVCSAMWSAPFLCLFVLGFIHSPGLFWIPCRDFHVVKPNGQISGLILLDLPSLNPVICLFSLKDILPLVFFQDTTFASFCFYSSGNSCLSFLCHSSL